MAKRSGLERATLSPPSAVGILPPSARQGLPGSAGVAGFAGDVMRRGYMRYPRLSGHLPANQKPTEGNLGWAHSMPMKLTKHRYRETAFSATILQLTLHRSHNCTSHTSAKDSQVFRLEKAQGEMDRHSQLIRGLRAMEALTEGPLTAAEIGRQVGVDRSTALRMCRELEDLGYVRRNAHSKRYEIVTARLYALAGNHHGARDWGEAVDPVLARLRDNTQEAAVLGVPAGNAVVYIAFCESLQPIAVREHVGAVRPIHASALGKAYLATLGPDELDAELGRLNYLGGTPNAAKGPMDLRHRLSEVQACGYATDWEETFEGVACVAAPVHLGGVLLGAIGISGPISRLSKKRLAQLGAEIIQEVNGIEGPSSSMNLG